MTLDLVAAVCMLTLMVGFVFGMIDEHSLSIKQQQDDQRLIKTLRELVALYGGRRIGDE